MVSGIAPAATIVVDQSGAGDYLTIAGAVAAAADGDEIVINPGTYDEYINLTRSVDFSATGGPGTVTWTGSGIHQLLNIEQPVTCHCTGIVFAGGRVTGVEGVGAAVHVGVGAVVTFDRCRFENNWAGWDCARSAQGSGTDVKVTGCEFRGNYAYHNAPAAGVLLSATMRLESCLFVDNTCDALAGAVGAYQDATLDVGQCVFLHNQGVESGALRYYDASGTATNNTFHDNTGDAVVVVRYSTAVQFTHNIVTTNAAGAGLAFDYPLDHDCNIFFDIAGPAVAGGDLAPGEQVTDPLYCNHELGELTLCSLSPALPANSGCGLIGALGEGCSDCGPIANESVTWGGLKAMFR